MTQGTAIERARNAKSKALRLLADQKVTASVGIARVGNGFGLKVNLQDSLEGPPPLPNEIDGVPVRFEVVGSVRKL